MGSKQTKFASKKEGKLNFTSAMEKYGTYVKALPGSQIAARAAIMVEKIGS
jgi:hypothetical protein